MWASLIVLAIVLAIIITTTVLVTKEINDVKKSLVKEESLSRTNEKTINDNWQRRIAYETGVISKTLSTTSSNLSSSITSTTASMSNQVYGSLNALSTQATAATAAMSNDISSFFGGFSNDWLRSSEMRISAKGATASYAKMSYDPINGVSISNNTNPISQYDLNVPRATIGTSLNVAGTLSFANNNSSYMLGVDGTSMYVKMQNPSQSFVIKDNGNTNRLDVSSSNITIDADARIIGSLNFADTTSSVSSHIFDTDKGDLFVRPTMLSGAFVVRDSTNTNRLMVKNDTIEITGDTRTTGNIKTQSQLCIKDKCITEEDIAKLKIM